MGRKAATRLMDLLDHAVTINRRDAIRHDLWGRGCNPPKDKLPNTENELLHSKRQWWTTGGEPRSNRGKKRKSNDPIGLIPPEAQAGVRRQCEVKAIDARGFSVRKVVGATKNPSWGKLRPNWEWPFRITSVAGIGAYYLEDLDEKVVPRPWNVNNLKMYYY